MNRRTGDCELQLWRSISELVYIRGPWIPLRDSTHTGTPRRLAVEWWTLDTAIDAAIGSWITEYDVI